MGGAMLTLGEATTTAIDLSGIRTATTNGLKEVGNAMVATVGDVLPVALLVVGAVIVVVFGIKMFKKITGK